MVQISAEQLASDPQGLLDRIAAGESFVVTRGDRAVAEVRPVACPRAFALGMWTTKNVLPTAHGQRYHVAMAAGGRGRTGGRGRRR